STASATGSRKRSRPPASKTSKPCRCGTRPRACRSRSGSFARCAPEVSLRLRRQVGEHRIGGDVLAQGRGIDLVEGVVRRVVQVEVVAAVVAEPGPGRAGACERADVRLRAALAGAPLHA